MKSIFSFFTTAVFTAVSFVCNGQSYILTPGDTIVSYVAMDELAVLNFVQTNNTDSVIYLSWEKVDTLVPESWEASICDNNTCFQFLEDDGQMLPVYAGEYGFLSLHVRPKVNSGIAIIKYLVWDTYNPNFSDTLTWIIHSDETGIENNFANEINCFVTGDQLIIQNTESENYLVTIFDLAGRIVFRSNLNSVSSIFDISHYPSETFLVDLRSVNFQVTKLFFHQ